MQEHISKEQFLQFIDLVKKEDNFINTLYNLNIDIINCEIATDYYLVGNILLNTNFTASGVDLIEWWLYEDVENKEIYEKDGPTYTLNTAEELWNYLIKYKMDYFK
jgi:hypothetical protein